jgi:hypothetical protein
MAVDAMLKSLLARSGLIRLTVGVASSQARARVTTVEYTRRRGRTAGAVT